MITWYEFFPGCDGRATYLTGHTDYECFCIKSTKRCSELRIGNVRGKLVGKYKTLEDAKAAAELLI